MFGMKITLAGQAALNAAIGALGGGLRDFRPVWPKVSLVFDRMERDQFVGQGVGPAGVWAALSPAYAKWKAVHFPGKPILFRTGDLVRSLTSPFDTNAVIEMTEDTLTRSTLVPYAKFVHARRPVIDPKPEDTEEMLGVVREYFHDLSIDLGFEVVGV